MCKVIPGNLLAPPAVQSLEQAEKIKKMDQIKRELAKEHLLKVQIALAKQSFGRK